MASRFTKTLITVLAVFLSVTFATVVALTWNDVVRMYWRPETKKEFTPKQKRNHIIFASVATVVAVLVMTLFSFIAHKVAPESAVPSMPETEL